MYVCMTLVAKAIRIRPDGGGLMMRSSWIVYVCIYVCMRVCIDVLLLKRHQCAFGQTVVG
jgi:hypothetical protein